MVNRIDQAGLLDTLSVWDAYMQKKIHLIACGGTALTLLNLKESTKDIDFIVPELDEYNYLIKKLGNLGYKQVTHFGWAKDDKFIFDLFRESTVYTTGLIESPLEKDNNILYKEFSSIYVGILNYYDLIISKLFRCQEVDLADCKILFQEKHKDINIDNLRERFNETAKYDISKDRILKNFDFFLEVLRNTGVKV